MATKNKAPQWGPVYLDEIQSIEVRKLSTGARDLWISIACRTRSAKNGPESAEGYFASYESLSKDIARYSKKTGQLEPISVRTVKRYASELKEAGLLDVQRTPGPACLVILRPPSLRSTKSVPSSEDRREQLHRSVPKRGQNFEERGQKMTQEVTSMGVTYSNSQRSHNSSEPGTTENDRNKKSISDMSKWMLSAAALGKSNSKENRFDLHDSFSKLGCDSWHNAAVVAPQAVRGSFARFRPDGISEAGFDQLIKAAGQEARIRCLEIFRTESAVVKSYRREHPELDIPRGATDQEADDIFEAELERRTGF
jgi:hypothetical protein